MVYVEDGDTLILLDASHHQHAIRLTDIDAPEVTHKTYGKPGQPYSKASTVNLTSLTKGHIATAHCYEYDQHQRLVCRITVSGIDTSLAQIRAGFAWAYAAAGGRYIRDARAYAYENEARQQRRGLWRDLNAVAPWIWRRRCWNGGMCSGSGE